MKRLVAYVLAGVALTALCQVAGPALTELATMQADITAALLVGFLTVVMVGIVAIFLFDVIGGLDGLRID